MFYRGLLCITFLLVSFWSGSVLALDRCQYFIAAGNSQLGTFKAAADISQAAGELICAHETSGSIASIKKTISDKSTVAALVSGDVLRALKNRNPEKMEGIRLLMPVQQSFVHILVRINSEIQQYSDLGDRVVCGAQSGSGVKYTGKILKARSGVRWVDAKEGYDRCLELLDRNSVDAFLFIAPQPVSKLKGLIGTRYRLVSVPSMKGYKTSLINTYGTEKMPVEPVQTLEVDVLLIVNEESLTNHYRVGNKMSMAGAHALSSMNIKMKDIVCSREKNVYGIDYSSFHKKACSLGYYGQDW